MGDCLFWLRKAHSNLRPVAVPCVRLGVSPQIASEDACKLEHAISGESFEALKSHFESMQN